MKSREAKIRVSYDDHADVLYLSSGKAVPTKSIEEEDGLVLRWDMETHRPVAATVMDFKYYWEPKSTQLVKRLASFFDITIEEARKAIKPTTT